MRVKWTVGSHHPKLLREFLRKQGVSRKLLAKLKFEGEIWLNDDPVRVTVPINEGDQVIIEIPPELRNEQVVLSDKPLDILYEDEALLVVNKPCGVASVPSPEHREDTMVNRVAAYISNKAYPHQAVHVVTRLDRETSGVMLFAKNGFIHALMDQQLRKRTLDKLYVAVVEGQVTPDYGILTFPIGRSQESIIERIVDDSDAGKPAKTEYWVREVRKHLSVVDVKLWTGRTHQIRVHFAHIGHPLVGDDLYGGHLKLLQRHALHCRQLTLAHPLTGQSLHIVADLPNDLQSLIHENNQKY